jgi:flagellar hook-associated protein 3 FlgL
MAMRITTKMMQNTSLRNINTNKAKQEDLTNQLSTGKKISRPSDDPVVAIRALKLNSTLDKIDQYYEKNAEDAESWLDLTSSAISTVNDILVTMKQNINQACNSYEEASDREAIITNLKECIEEIYSTGNADSGGRSIFTGYRTDMSLTIQEDTTNQTTIKEQLTNADIGTKTFVATGALKNINEGNFADIDDSLYEVTTNEVYRIRLAYSDLDMVTTQYEADGTTPKTYQTIPTGPLEGQIIHQPEVSITYEDPTTGEWKGYTPTAVFATGTDEAYQTAVDDENAVVYIADTGELLLGSKIQEKLSKLPSDTEIRVTYDKTNWEEGDLDPVHYFYTQRDGVEYNASFLEDSSASGKQIIEYDIGNNQTIRVNTTADEVFTHDMGRDVDEVIEMLNEYTSVDDALTTVQNLIDSEQYAEDSDEYKTLTTQKEALEKAKTYVGDKINKRCSALLTNCDNYAERTQLAETNCGSRGTRLTLIQNRLNVQQTNFEELVSENEDADYTDLAIQLKSVEMTYEAALSSISYVMQTSLLDFI